jgi:hypothetical protein
MTIWTADELEKIGGADELEITSLRRDGTLRKSVIVWVVRWGDGLFVRSGYGPEAAWYRGIQVRREGHVKAGGVDKDVTFEDVDHALDSQIDAAYHAKYDRYGARYVGMVVVPEAQSTTIKLLPRTTR